MDLLTRSAVYNLTRVWKCNSGTIFNFGFDNVKDKLNKSMREVMLIRMLGLNLAS